MIRKITAKISASITMKEIFVFGQLKTPFIENVNYDLFWRQQIQGLLKEALLIDATIDEFVVSELFIADLLIPNQHFYDIFNRNYFRLNINGCLERYDKYKTKQ